MPSILRPLQLDASPPDSPVLAKSRRKADHSTQKIVPADQLVRRLSIPDLPFQKLPLKEYVLHLPILLIGLAIYAAVLFVLNAVPPRQLQNVWIPNSYAPFLLLVGVGHFCAFSYLFLNTRRGFLTSLFLSIILFLKLQQVLTPQLILWTAIALAVTEAVFIIFHRLLLKFQPNLKLPQLPRFGTWQPRTRESRTLPTDLVDNSQLKPLPIPKKFSHRQPRKRKHHFFGK